MMAKYRPLLLLLVSLGLAALVWMDNRETWFGGKGQIVASHPHKDASIPVTANDAKATEADQATEESDASETTQLNGNPLASFDKASLQNWVDRPLFAPSRKRPPKKADQKTAKKAPPPPDYKLLGVVLNHQRTIALLKSQGSGADYRVQVGDMIGGWHVAMVEKDSVTLERDGEEAQKVRFAKDCKDSDDDSC